MCGVFELIVDLTYLSAKLSHFGSDLVIARCNPIVETGFSVPDAIDIGFEFGIGAAFRVLTSSFKLKDLIIHLDLNLKAALTGLLRLEAFLRV